MNADLGIIIENTGEAYLSASGQKNLIRSNITDFINNLTSQLFDENLSNLINLVDIISVVNAFDFINNLTDYNKVTKKVNIKIK